MTRKKGKKNQNSPFSKLVAWNLDWNTTRHTVTMDHMCWLSWKRIKPGFKVKTDTMNIAQYIP